MPRKILLADDSITIQKVVELTFSDGDYEVVATSNGAKAIQKLAEFRPDIILSDIIMPEKNGYEVCEFVKSHPEYRTIPVILLTGTFEPFDPDRAEKAGCDAVVTKPFESQGLIHKVEELIEQARAASAPTGPSPALLPEVAGNSAAATRTWPLSAFSGGAPEPAAAPAPATVADEESPFAPEESSPFAEDVAPPPQAAPEPPPFEPHSDQIFGGSSSAPAPSAPLPIERPAMSGGETRAFPAMNFSDLLGMEPEPPAAPVPAAPMWSQQEPQAPGAGETRAFPSLSVEDLQRLQAEPLATPSVPPFEPVAPAATAPSWSPEPPPAFEEESPFASEPAAIEPPPTVEQSIPTAEAWSQATETIREPDEPHFGETTELPWQEPAGEPVAEQKNVWAETAPPEESPARETLAEAPAWQTPAEEEVPSWQQPIESAPSWEPPATEPASTWDEAPDVATAPPWEPPIEEPAPWDVPPEEPAAPSWEQQVATAAPASLVESAAGSAGPWEEPEAEPEPATEPAPAPFLQPAPEPATPLWEQPEPAAAPSWQEPESVPAWQEPMVAAAPAPAPEAPAKAAASFGELTDEQVDRIARRVVQLLSNDVVKSVAWEVIPDLAESIVRERIRQLESEA